jgi:hypothetical protein
VPRNTAESLGKCFSITMLTSRADLQAPPNGVPGGFSPFDL